MSVFFVPAHHPLANALIKLSRKYKAIFAIQDEPPSWPSDSDEMGMESVSDVDGGDFDIEGPEDAFSISPEPDDLDEKEKELILDEKEMNETPGRQSDEVTTEEEPVDPLTPGPVIQHTQSFHQAQMAKPEEEKEIDLLGDDDDWVDPGIPVETPTPFNPHRLSAVRMSPANSGDSAATSASYVSASSSYSSIVRESDSESKGSPVNKIEQHGVRGVEPAKAAEKMSSAPAPKEGKKGRASKVRSGKSKVPSSSSAQEYVPFPVVDDRDPEDADAEGDADFVELSSQSESSQMRGGRDGARMRTITTSSRTPVASVVMRDRELGAGGEAHHHHHHQRNGTTAGLGGVGGSRIRNTFARDGGRTQSGGVRGIVATDPQELPDLLL